MLAKQSERAIKRAIRDNLDRVSRCRETHVACTLAARLALARRPRIVGLYAAIGSELDTAPLAAQLARAGVAVAYPVVTGPDTMEFRLKDASRMQPWLENPARTYPPDPEAAVRPDVLVVPGLAFGKEGERLGYGGGYYDRYLDGDSTMFTIGVGYSRQLGKNILINKYDARTSAVVLGNLIIAESN